METWNRCYRNHGIEKLSAAENWCTWKFAVRNLLRGTDNAYEVCNGQVTKPARLRENASLTHQATYNAALKTRNKADRAASQILVKTLESKVMALLVQFCNSARDMWMKLHATFEQKTRQSAHTVQSEFFNFRVCAGDNMVEHIAKFENIIYRIKQLSVAPDEASQVVKLVDTLLDSFDVLRQAWWARQEEQQTYANLVELLTSDKRSRNDRKQRNDELVVLVAATAAKVKKEKSTNGAAGQQRKSAKKSGCGPRCYKCNGFGHISKNCSTQAKKEQYE